jgi:hypothetical protein
VFSTAFELRGVDLPFLSSREKIFEQKEIFLHVAKKLL